MCGYDRPLLCGDKRGSSTLAESSLQDNGCIRAADGCPCEGVSFALCKTCPITPPFPQPFSAPFALCADLMYITTCDGECDTLTVSNATRKNCVPLLYLHVEG